MAKKCIRAIFVLVPFLLFPFPAFADQVSGGFPSGSIWISETAPVAGDSVQIYAPVYDASGKKISGDVVFLVDGAAIGSVHFSLNAGEAKIASLPWSAKEGEHTFAAKIQNAADADSAAALSLSGEEAQGVTVTVAPAPPQPAIVQALNTAAGVAQSAVSASAPAIIAAANAIHNETEVVRTAAQTALEKSLGEPSLGAGGGASAAAAGKVLGVQTYQGPLAAAAAAAAAPSSSSVVRVFEEIALFIVSYQWVFYPLLILLILLALYLVAKHAARPRPARA